MKEYYALLDVISCAEGTCGVSNNGYDVVVGHKRVIDGWTEDTDIVHGGMDWYDKSLNSTAAGRYQFTISTWRNDMRNKNGGIIVGKNLPMTKENQNKRGIELVQFELRNSKIPLSSLETNKNNFKLVINNLSNRWEGLLGNPKYSVDVLYDIYKVAISRY